MKNSLIVRIAGGAIVFGMVGLAALTGVAYATVPTFSQTSVTVGVNQSISISTQNGTSIYLGVNSTPTVVSVSTNGTQVTFTGIQPGTANVSLCNVGTASDCVTLYITVQSGTVSTTATTTTTTSNTSGLSFSLNNLSLATGQSTTTIISGGNGAYSITGNSNSADISVGMSGGNGLIIDGMEPGRGTVTVCDSVNVCGTVSVTIGGSSSTSTSNGNQAVSFSVANPTVAVGQTLNVTLSGGTTFFILANPSPNIALANINGSTLTLAGESAGSDAVIVSVAGGGYSPLPVTVTGTASASTATTPTTTSSPAVTTTPVNTTVPSTITPNTTLLSEIQALQNAVSQALAQIESIQTQLSQVEAQVNAGSGGTVSGGTGSASISSSGATLNELLSVGAANAQVTALQEHLATLGDYVGPVTGFYGSLTQSAVTKYQTAHGIEATGSVGPLTQAALNAGN